MLALFPEKRREEKRREEKRREEKRREEKRGGRLQTDRQTEPARAGCENGADASARPSVPNSSFQFIRQ